MSANGKAGGFAAIAVPDVVYDYADAEGQVVFQKVRKPGKHFLLRRPNGSPDTFIYDLDGIDHKPLYRLPEVLAAKFVIKVEGEKDVENVRSALDAALPKRERAKWAVTTSYATTEWDPRNNVYFTSKEVFLLADNDKAGHEAANLCGSHLTRHARSVRVDYFTDLPEHGDVSDWLAGHTGKELLARIKAARLWKGKAAKEPTPSEQPQVNAEHNAQRKFVDGLIERHPELKAKPWKPWKQVNEVRPCRCPLHEAKNEKHNAVLGVLADGRIFYSCHHAACKSANTDLPRLLKHFGEDAVVEELLALPPEFSEEALARALVERYGEDLRYTAKLGYWYHWDGSHWKEDEVLAIFTKARKVCTATANTCPNQSVRRTLAAAHTVAATERLARCDVKVVTRVEEWDANPWELNTPAGIVDLQTGELAPHRREAYHSKVTAVGPGGTCKLWLEFLARITNGDQELQDYLQRVAGYGLTGSIQEEAMFFAHGKGANGKGTYTSTLLGIAGPYARTCPPEMLMVAHGDRHPTDIARLRGVRLAVTSETEQGSRWAEAKIKTLTGGDTVAARFMRQDFFEYRPQFKLFIAGNHKPYLNGVDEAIRRRLHLIPFSVIIPENERDPKLKEKLKREWSGVLQWAIEGAVEWRKGGLRPPECVLSATAQYLKEEDAIARWTEDFCNVDKAYTSGSGELYLSWKNWAETNKEFVISHRKFSQTMQEHGFTAYVDGDGKRKFKGIALKPASEVNY